MSEQPSQDFEQLIDSDPDNVESWMVYADYLQELGHPYGVMIALAIGNGIVCRVSVCQGWYEIGQTIDGFRAIKIGNFFDRFVVKVPNYACATSFATSSFMVLTSEEF